MTLNKYQWLGLLILAAIGGYLFYDYILQILLGIFGLGTAAVIAKQDKADKAKTVADEHESMADAYIIKSVNDLKQAETAHDRAIEISETDDITPIPVKPGGVRKKFTSR